MTLIMYIKYRGVDDEKYINNCNNDFAISNRVQNSSQPLAIEEDKPIVTTVEDAATETTSEIDNQEVVIDDAAEETITTIAELFMKHNLKVGTCLSPEMLNRKESEELILNQFNSITMENALKPDFIALTYIITIIMNSTNQMHLLNLLRH